MRLNQLEIETAQGGLDGYDDEPAEKIIRLTVEVDVVVEEWEDIDAIAKADKYICKILDDQDEVLYSSIITEEVVR